MTEGIAASNPGSFEELRAKYELEKTKRLRDDGAEQYRPLEGVFADFDKDSYADPNFSRDAVIEQIDVAIIGSGLGGMMAAGQLVQRGVTNIRLIDKAGDFGGTWYWNRYPGAACDVESYIYLPFLEETGYIPTEKYAKASEIFEHCQRIGRHFDLYPKGLFQTTVEALRWQDDIGRWLVTTDRGDRIEARFAIIAGGILHKPKLPGIPGMEVFQGKSFHTSHWDYDYTGGTPVDPRMDKLADKRVALIGTGATSIQVMPKLAEAAGELYVFQRTPSGVGRRDNRPTDPAWAASLKPGWQKERMENFTRIISGEQTDRDLVQDGWTEIFRNNPDAQKIATEEQQRLDFESMEKIRARVDEIIEDPEVAEALKPWYNQMCKRPCFHDEYLPAYNRPNVHLVDTEGKGVERITEDAVVVAGKAYPVDCIVYASGFDIGSPLQVRMGFEIYGRGGVGLADAWAGGPATLHGMTTRGFPNMMMFHTTQTGFAVNFVHMLSELADHTAWLIAHCIGSGIKEIEPTEEAQEGWFQVLLSRMGGQGMFYAQCTPSYANGEGFRSVDPTAIRRAPFFGSTAEFVDILTKWREAGDLQGLEITHA